MGAPVKMRIAVAAAVGGEVGEADGVAVDRRIVMRRHADRGNHVFCQDSAECVGEADCFGCADGDQTAGQQVAGGLQGHQRAAEGEAIVTELGHDSLRWAASGGA